MALPIEGVTCRVIQGSITSTVLVTPDNITDAKFAIVDIWVEDTTGSQNTTNTSLSTQMSTTRWMIDRTSTAVVGFDRGSNFGEPDGISLFNAYTSPNVRIESSSATADATVLFFGNDVLISLSSVAVNTTVHYIIRVYGGRGILNAELVNQAALTTSVTGLSFQPNTILAMGASNSTNYPSYGFGGVDSQLNQASYCYAATNANTGSTRTSDTHGLVVVRGTYDTSISRTVEWNVTAFTSDGWTNGTVNTVSQTFYIATNTYALAIELADPSEFKIGLSAETNTLAETVTLSNAFSNMNWETLRGANVNATVINGGTGVTAGHAAYTADGTDYASVGGSFIMSNEAAVAAAGEQYLRLTTTAAVDVVDDITAVNTWTPSTGSAPIGIDYTLTTGSAVAEDCAYLSWGFVQTPQYDIYIGEEVPQGLTIQATEPSEIRIGNISVTNVI
jgi:hypothetical protein